MTAAGRGVGGPRPGALRSGPGAPGRGLAAALTGARVPAALRLGLMTLALLSVGVLPAAADQPQVNFQASPRRGGVPLTVQFTDTTNVAGGTPISFAWTFGDGGASGAEHPSHTYTAAGKYEVSLTVTDDHGHVGQKIAKDFITVDPPGLVAAVLPMGRSVQVGAPATAYVSVINVGAITATGVGIGIDPSTAPGGVPGAPLAGLFTFQTTDPLTNQLTGAPGSPVDIPAGGAQTYAVAITPTGPFPPTDVRFEIEGTNSGTAQIVPGLNTLLLSASAVPVPDIVAVSRIADGASAVEIPGLSGAAAFAVATVNVGGAGGSITVSADTGSTPLPLSLAVCGTDPSTGACTTAVAPAIATAIAPGATPTFAVFVAGVGAVPFDPERHRIFVRFSEGAVARGATSVAVRTQ